MRKPFDGILVVGRAWTFYCDPTTGKLRELDVLARRSWSQGSENDDVSVSLQLFVEVKSLRGYHLVFSSDAPAVRVGTRPGSRPQYEWCGNRSQQIASACVEAGIALQSTKALVEWFKRVAYSQPDGGMSVEQYLAKPPKSSVHATAFRETNVGGEKDLDNSVLWKLIQGLESILESERVRFIDGLQSDLKLKIEVAQLDGRASSRQFREISPAASSTSSCFIWSWFWMRVCG